MTSLLASRSWPLFDWLLYKPSSHRGQIRLESRSCFKNHPRKKAKPREMRPPNPRKEMIAKEVQSIFNSNKLIAVYHCNNLSAKDSHCLRVALDKGRFTMKVVPSKLAMRVLEETKFRNFCPLLRGSSALVYSQEPDVSQLLQATKSEQKVLLLGGLVENELMTPNGMKNYSNLPEKTVVYQQLAGTIMQTQLVLSSQLMASQTHLSQLLQQVCSKED